MTKSELIKILIKQKPNLPLDTVTSIVDTIFNEMSDTLAKDNRIEIRGFGTFSIRERTARIAKNPKTNEKLQVDARKVIYFRMGKLFKEKINAK